MEFRLLGPVEVFDGNDSVPLGGPRHREVLAILLLDANRIVSTDHLIDALWGEQPPKTARNSVQRFVSDLRKALGDEDGSLLRTESAGYLLEVAGGELDIDVFEALATQGREALADGHAEEAASFLQMALALWAGGPLGELGYAEFARGRVAQLEESRMAVVEDRIEAELAMSRHTALIGELEGLTAEHPFRERLWGQLMLALYRAGRQAEALRTYQNARDLLGEKLGIEPSPPLQLLEEQILMQDASLVLARVDTAETVESVSTGIPVRSVRGYELREAIGAGTFGVVHRAYQASVGREVAIKVIRPGYANNPEFIRRFEGEAQHVARLEHPHIVPLYDFWRGPDGAYLAMRWMRAGSLAGTLRRGPWSIEATGRLVEQIGSALRIAHRQGVVHGDIKPANILLDEDGNAYLSDFGIATDLVLEATDQAQAASASSAGYRAPEQVRGQPATLQTDIFSLGLVLFELLAGHHPFAGLTGDDLASALLAQPVPPLATPGTYLPPAIDDVIARATAPEPADRYADMDELMTASAAVARPEALPDDIVVVDASIDNPYKGLRAFSQSDAADFFGRRALVKDLVGRLDESRFLALVGPSGSGKSSVVRAGLVPALQAGRITGSERWFVVEMVPGAHPLEELEAGLLRIAVNPPPTLLEQLRADENGFRRAIKRVLPEDDSELVLVVDQFEELFTLVSDEENRAHFLESLRAAVDDPHARIRVVVTLRADFYDRPLAYRSFGELVRAGTETILPLSLGELEEAIAAPAERKGVTFEAGLIAEMAGDVNDQPGALPLLQYALTELFEKRRGNSLTKDAYRSMGGALGALGQRAEELYLSLDQGGRDATRQLFLRLVAVGHGPEDDTRRRVLRSELLSLEGDRRPMESAIESYGRHRLLSFDRDPVTRGPTVEVAHEALLREWGHLRGWIEDSRQDLAAHRRLATATEEWAGSQRDDGFLLTGSRLAQMETWSTTSGLALTATERELIDASHVQRETEEATEVTRAEREATTERRSVRRLRALVGVLLLAVVATASLSLVALDRSRRANRDALAATVQSLMSAAVVDLNTDPEASVLLALEAVDRLQAAGQDVPGDLLDLTDEALNRMQVQRRFEPGVVADITADATMVATAGADGELFLWEAETGDLVVQLTGPEQAMVISLEFSPNGAQLAAIRRDSGLQVWDMAAKGLELELPATLPDPLDVSWNADGRFVAVSGLGWLQVWDVGRVEVAYGRFNELSESMPASLSGDGRLVAFVEPVAVGAANRASNVEIRRVDEPINLIATLVHPEDRSVCAVSFHPSGNRIATAGADGVVSVWSLDSVPSDADDPIVLEDPSALLVGHLGAACALAWTADGTLLVTGGSDGTARLWDTDTAREVARLSGQGGAVTSVGITLSGHQVVTATADGVTRLWDPAAGSDREALITEPGPVFHVVFSPQGDRLVISSLPRVAVRDLATGTEILVIEDEGGRLVDLGLAVSDDGRLLASPFLKHSAIGVYDATSGDLLRTLSSLDDAPYEMTFLGGTHHLVAANQTETVKVWNADDGSAAPLLVGDEHSDDVRWLDATPQGDRLVTGSIDGTAIVWEASTLDVIAILGHGETVFGEIADVAISPDGRVVAVATFTGAVQVWDVASESLERALEGHIGQVNTVRFSPDGSALATGGSDGTARVWDTSSWEQTRIFTGHEGEVLDVAFSPDGLTLATAGRDGTIRLRILDADTLIAIARARVTRSLTDAECAAYIPSGSCD